MESKSLLKAYDVMKLRFPSLITMVEKEMSKHYGGNVKAYYPFPLNVSIDLLNMSVANTA
ncbi:CLUMA_CG007309, isoform A [Clunio marinus]|uniref:CLUMA_CG007309, isoform A n=1 Tax=Clunio marinus TaxID=568069 RepID=A0A1J1I2G0_9DIPT|nr:CLUMA_CG007309, isoform A [Clunio marinus]